MTSTITRHLIAERMLAADELVQHLLEANADVHEVSVSSARAHSVFRGITIQLHGNNTPARLAGLLADAGLTITGYDGIPGSNAKAKGELPDGTTVELFSGCAA